MYFQEDTQNNDLRGGDNKDTAKMREMSALDNVDLFSTRRNYFCHCLRKFEENQDLSLLRQLVRGGRGGRDIILSTGKVELSVIHITVEMFIFVEHFTNGNEVGPQDRALGHICGSGKGLEVKD